MISVFTNEINLIHAGTNTNFISKVINKMGKIIKEITAAIKDRDMLRRCCTLIKFFNVKLNCVKFC